MRELIIVSPNRIDLAKTEAAFQEIGQSYLPTEDGEEGIRVWGTWGHVHLVRSRDPKSYYERVHFSNALKKYMPSVEAPEVYVMEHGHHLDAALVLMVLPRSDVLVDNTHRLVLPIDEIRRRIKWGEPWEDVKGQDEP